MALADCTGGLKFKKKIMKIMQLSLKNFFCVLLVAKTLRNIVWTIRISEVSQKFSYYVHDRLVND